MNTTLFTIVVGCRCVIGMAATFANLDFDNPHLNAVLASGHSPKTSDAVPGWSVMYGAVLAQSMLFENQALIGRGVTLFYNQPDSSFQGFGRFNLLLQSGWDPTVGSSVSVSLSQKAVVPSDASSLTFIGWLLPDHSLFSVSMNGNDVPFVELERRERSSIYGIDVSPWRGKEAELRFTVYPPTTETAAAFLDHIEFSPLALVPEPGEVVLLAVGVGVFVAVTGLRGSESGTSRTGP